MDEIIYENVILYVDRTPNGFNTDPYTEGVIIDDLTN